MPKYSNSSKEKLSTCHFELQLLMNYVIQFYDNTIVCGTRGKKEQTKAYNEGNSKVKYPNSKHNTIPSIAIDAAPYERTGIDWSIKQSAHFAGYVKAVADMLYKFGYMKHRVRCGADWDNDNDIDDTTFWDAGHFELIPLEGEKFDNYNKN